MGRLMKQKVANGGRKLAVIGHVVQKSLNTIGNKRKIARADFKMVV